MRRIVAACVFTTGCRLANRVHPLISHPKCERGTRFNPPLIRQRSVTTAAGECVSEPDTHPPQAQPIDRFDGLDRTRMAGLLIDRLIGWLNYTTIKRTGTGAPKQATSFPSHHQSRASSRSNPLHYHTCVRSSTSTYALFLLMAHPQDPPAHTPPAAPHIYYTQRDDAAVPPLDVRDLPAGAPLLPPDRGRLCGLPLPADGGGAAHQGN